MATVRVPARDLGGPIWWPVASSMYCRRMLTVAASRSMSHRRSAMASPHRKLAKVASRPSPPAMACGHSRPNPAESRQLVAAIGDGLRAAGLRRQFQRDAATWVSIKTPYTGGSQAHGLPQVTQAGLGTAAVAAVLRISTRTEGRQLVDIMIIAVGVAWVIVVVRLLLGLRERSANTSRLGAVGQVLATSGVLLLLVGIQRAWPDTSTADIAFVTGLLCLGTGAVQLAARNRAKRDCMERANQPRI
jgi:hypothetical protein